MKNKKFLAYRRKREGKTDYKRRLALLKSGRVRLVIRKSLKYVTVQFVQYETDGDKTLFSHSSKELKKLGWKGSAKNISAGYLTGLMCGKKAKGKNVESAIVDLGLTSAKKCTIAFGVLKGVVDAGLSVPHDPVVFPSDERIKGSHISENTVKMFEDIKNKIEQVK